MPEPIPPDASRPARTAAERAADHAAIDRLSAELLPALMAKLAATGLGELEVREGAWRVRLRRPAEGAPGRDRRPERDRGERGSRSVTAGAPGHPAYPGHAGHPGHAGRVAGLTPVGPGRDGREARDGRDGRDGARDETRTVASSPAVGIFQPRADARAGTRVRAGDRIGSVDLLGIPQEVVAPADGVVGASLVEPGDAVEFGQDLIIIEFASAAASSTSNPPAES